MTSSSPDKMNKSSKIQSGFAGAGGGALFVLIVDLFNPSLELKNIVSYVAPSVAIGFSWLWSTFGNVWETYNRERKLKATINSLNTKFQQYLNNPNTSEEHKAKLREKLEEVEMKVIESDLKLIKAS